MTSEAQILHTIETGHSDVINDAILDYYGTTLATASNDCTIRLFDVRNNQSREIKKLTDHTGQIWQLAWAHPFFGQVLASCSYNGDCIIYKKDEKSGDWVKFHNKKYSKALNSVCWAPPEFGLRLAIASSEEDIIILTYCNDTKDWTQTKVPAAHSMGVKAVSWAPGNMPSSLFQKDSSQATQKSAMRLVSGGDESKVRIWRYDETVDKWESEGVLEGHSDWIRDVAWAPNIGLPEEQIASCSTDKRVIIWSKSLANPEVDTDEHEMSTKCWKPHMLPVFSDVISHVSWSLTGGVLACSGGVNHVSLWKQDLSGEWIQLDDMNQLEMGGGGDMVQPIANGVTA